MVVKIDSRQEFEEACFQPDTRYVLTSDIEVGDEGLSTIEKFHGTLDGNGHSIKNFSSERISSLILENNGIIKNLKIENLRIYSEDIIGGLCSLNKGKIINCHVSADLKSEMNLGGLASGSAGLIEGCSFEGTAESEDKMRVGGIVSENMNYGTIRGCHSSGHVRGGFRVGGIAGQNGEEIESCSSEVTVENNQNPNGPLGGIVGRNYGVLQDSYFDGEMKTENNSNMEGVIVGKNCHTIRNCHSTDVEGEYLLIGEGSGVKENNTFKETKKKIERAIMANKI